MLLMWEISLWYADIQTEADMCMCSVCMDQLQYSGSRGFRRTDTTSRKFPAAPGNIEMVSACLRRRGAYA